MISVSISRTRLTTAQFIDWSADCEQAFELIDGVARLMPPENYFNTTIARCLERYLELFFPWFRLSRDLEIELDTRNTRIPDLCVVRTETPRQLRESPRAIIRLGDPPPLIGVEVVSPGSSDRDYGSKLKEYAAIGITEYWILDPRVHTAAIYSLGNDGQYRAMAQSTETGTTIADLIKLMDKTAAELG